MQARSKAASFEDSAVAGRAAAADKSPALMMSRCFMMFLPGGFPVGPYLVKLFIIEFDNQ